MSPCTSCGGGKRSTWSTTASRSGTWSSTAAGGNHQNGVWEVTFLDGTTESFPGTYAGKMSAYSQVSARGGSMTWRATTTVASEGEATAQS